jgi:Raf kinase inhibitor-like YbhB/YbcL family protein
MKIMSTAFEQDGDIPLRFTSDGENLSPPLEWSGVPSGCHSFVLVCDDPDAPQRAEVEHPFVHWVVYNISPNITYLPEGLLPDERLEIPVPLLQGKNSFGNIGYDGPMPPLDSGPHRYIFTLYALSKMLDVVPGLEKKAISEAMNASIVATAQISGKYERRTERREKSGFEAEVRP